MNSCEPSGFTFHAFNICHSINNFWCLWLSYKDLKTHEHSSWLRIAVQKCVHRRRPNKGFTAKVLCYRNTLRIRRCTRLFFFPRTVGDFWMFLNIYYETNTPRICCNQLLSDPNCHFGVWDLGLTLWDPVDPCEKVCSPLNGTLISLLKWSNSHQQHLFFQYTQKSLCG